MPLALEQHSTSTLMKMWPLDQRLLYQQELIRATQDNRNQQRNHNALPQLTRDQQLSMLGLPVPSQGMHLSSSLLNERQSLDHTLGFSLASASSQHYSLLLMAMQEQEQSLHQQYMQQQQHPQQSPQHQGAHGEGAIQPNLLFPGTTVAGRHMAEDHTAANASLGGKRADFLDELPSKTVTLAPDPIKDSHRELVTGEKPKPKKKHSKWLTTLKELREYKESHGDCIVPRGYTANPRLASWVAEQRKQFKLMKDGKQSSITAERVALLTDIGFAWNAQEAAWCRHMDDLKKFRDETGHCNVPLNHPHYPKLGLWVKEQRRHYTLLKQGKQSHMTQERAEELDAIGFCWDTHEATWLERLRELSDFKDKHGNCLVPTNYTGNPKLGTWVHHQRRQYKKFKENKACHITEERIRALESLGFVWYPRDRSTEPGSNDDSSDASVDTELSLDFRPRKRQRSM